MRWDQILWEEALKVQYRVDSCTKTICWGSSSSVGIFPGSQLEPEEAPELGVGFPGTREAGGSTCSRRHRWVPSWFWVRCQILGCGVVHQGCSQITGRHPWFWKTSAPPSPQATPGDLVAPLRTRPHPMGFTYLTGGGQSRPRGQEEPWMRGLALRAPSHGRHIPDCILHAAHGIHSL